MISPVNAVDFSFWKDHSIQWSLTSIKLTIIHIFGHKFLVGKISELIQCYCVRSNLIWGHPLIVKLPVLIESKKSLTMLLIIAVLNIVLLFPFSKSGPNSIRDFLGQIDSHILNYVILFLGIIISANSYKRDLLTACIISTRAIITWWNAYKCTEFVSLLVLKNATWLSWYTCRLVCRTWPSVAGGRANISCNTLNGHFFFIWLATSRCVGVFVMGINIIRENNFMSVASCNSYNYSSKGSNQKKS